MSRARRSGVAVQVRQGSPLAVLSSQFTGKKDFDLDLPDGASVDRMLGVGPEQLASILNLEEVEKRLKNGKLLPPRITGTKLWIYRFSAKDRSHGSRQRKDPTPFHFYPHLPLRSLPPTIRDGKDYVVVQVFFTLSIEGWGSLNWTALIEPETQAVLMLRAFVEGVSAWVFTTDPVTLSGTVENGPAATNAELDLLREFEPLLGLSAAIGDQSLAGQYIAVQDFYAPSVLPPTQPSGSDFDDYNARTNDFAAVNAYYHCDAAFRLVADMGFTGYFDGTTFSVPVEHRGSADFDGIFGGPTDNNSNQVNAQSLGNAAGNGQGGLNFFLADTTDLEHPIGIACDRRVVLHEFGHTILWDHVSSPNFGFSHSAGDPLAAILNDPSNQAPDRFDTFPWAFQSLPAAAARRHDRAVAAGWGWGGAIGTSPFDFVLDYAGYNNERSSRRRSSGLSIDRW